MFLANLKVAPAGGGGGGSAAPGGDGRPPIIYPPTNPGQQPIQYPDGGALEDGDLWWDPDSGYLYIYLNGEWHPIGERPPVAVQPTPPDYNASGDVDNQYPIVEGDLWFDSDQLALYVAAEDEAGDLRWVITTPADRSVLQDEVDIPDLPFRFPSPKTGGGNPFDGMTVYNPVTKLWYVFNAGKNQWIDLPPGVNELSMTALLVRGPDDMNDQFAYRQADRDRLGTDALCYVNADTHEDWTRMVIPNHDLAGFDWTLITTAIIKGDQVSLIQFEKEDDPDLPDYTLRSDHKVESNFASVPPQGPYETKNGDISFLVKEPSGDAPFFDEEVIIRFKAIVNTGEDEIYYQENAPDPITDPELTAGNIWIDSTDNLLYVWTGDNWAEVSTCSGGGGGTGDYVKRKGDSMYGDLLFKWDEKTDDDDYLLSVRTNNTYNPKQRNFNGDYPEFELANSLYLGPKDDQSNSGLEIYAAAKGVNYGHYLEVSGRELWSAAYGTDGNITSTITHRYNGDFDFRSAGTSASGGFYVDVHNQDPNSKISFYANTSIELNTMSGYELYLDEQNGLTYNATIVETDDPKTVTNKEYVDTFLNKYGDTVGDATAPC